MSIRCWATADGRDRAAHQPAQPQVHGGDDHRDLSLSEAPLCQAGKAALPDLRPRTGGAEFRSILAMVEREARRGEARLLAPLVRSRKGIYRDLFLRLKKLGFETVLVDGKWLPLDPAPALARHREHDIEVLVSHIGARGALPGELSRGRAAGSCPGWGLAARGGSGTQSL